MYMKKFIITKCMTYIKKHTNYNETKLKEIEYGLTGLYLTVTKLIVISIIAIVLGIFKELLIFLLIYNFIRMPSFGLHATKSWICLISSSIVFLGIPYLCLNLDINIKLKILVGILGSIFMFINSPADTKKRPIVNKKRRLVYKIISTIVCITYFILSLIIKNQLISNCFIFAIILQNFMISPITYKIFKQPYNNYKKFLIDHPDFAK